MAREDKGPDVDLFDRDSLLRWLEWADVRLLDTNWILVAPPEVLAQRRQDLPPEAFVPFHELAEKPLVSLSYGWAHPANPDPNGDYASLLKKYLSREGEVGVYAYGKTTYPQGAALFWDHKSLHQHLMDSAWDGASQTWEASVERRRTETEEKYFKRALGNMQALYFHAEADALIMENVPDGAQNDTKYEKRGWTAMECAGACLSGRVTGLKTYLSDVIDPLFSAALPPMTFDDFEMELRGRRFTNGNDSGVVLEMYRVGFEAYAAGAREVSVNVDVADETKCRRLAKALPHFGRLQKFCLKGYPNCGDCKYRELNRELDTLAAKGCQVFANQFCPMNYPWPRSDRK